MPAKSALARMWAPWRMAYIDAATPPRRGAASAATASVEAPCLFCRVLAAADDRQDLVLARRPQALLMLNRYPYNPGHLMVAVRAHKARFHELSARERKDVDDLVAIAEQALDVEYHPHGVNYGANFGRVAGAGFPGHLHVHLVPRWNGDTNFMPVVGETKVLPESLSRTWRRLRRAVQRVQRGRRGASR